MKTRVISGVVLLVVLALMLILGGPVLWTGLLIVSLIGTFELMRIMKTENRAMGYAAYLGVIIYYLAILVKKPEGVDETKFLLSALIIDLLIIMCVFVFTYPRYNANQAMAALFSIIYVAVMLSYVYRIRVTAGGIYTVWLVFVASWVNDTCAYFSGVTLGKHKMTPKLSPKKSIEGAIGGVVGATLVGLLFGAIVSKNLTDGISNPLLAFSSASFFGSFIAIVGDLAASAIKRSFKIKDYGKLIPGHGGILDRFDSVIFTAPVIYAAINIVNYIFRH